MQVEKIALSYVMTTYNKLSYLKVVLEDVIENRKEDEEIIVVDGGSMDGTKEYLVNLQLKGRIQKFVSERDKGEGHGFNKGMLLAEGLLIKLLTDDDIYDFSEISECRAFMLNNPTIDYLNTHGGWYDIRLDNEILLFTDVYINMLKEWEKSGKPFAFCMLGTIINRKSLAYLGLINPIIKRADAEYSLRITSQKIKMAWYTGVTYVRILNNDSNSVSYIEKIKEETFKLNAFYNVIIDMDAYSQPKLINTAARILHKLIRFKQNASNREIKISSDKVLEISFSEAFQKSTSWLKRFNQISEKEFYIVN